jgi:hypothetical protein
MELRKSELIKLLVALVCLCAAGAIIYLSFWYGPSETNQKIEPAHAVDEKGQPLPERSTAITVPQPKK